MFPLPIPIQLTPLSSDFKASLDTLQTRTSHLAEIHDIVAASAAAPLSPDDPDSDPLADASTPAHSYQQWSDVRLQRMITDWLLRRGYLDAADKFVTRNGIAPLTDLALFKELSAIRSSLIPTSPSAGTSTTTPSATPASPPRTCALALAWCMDNKVALRRIKSTLEFDLRLQEFIDLCRNRSPESLASAVTHARRHLLPAQRTAQDALAQKEESDSTTLPSAAEHTTEDDEGAEELRRNNEKIVETVSRAWGLLAIGPGGWAYEDLYSYSRYSKLYDTLRTAALSIHSLPPQPLLHIALSAGLSSLKVPACYGGRRGPTSKSSAEAKGSTDTEEDRLMFKLNKDEDTPASAVRQKREEKRNPEELRNEDCPVCSTVRIGKKRSAPEDEDSGKGESEGDTKEDEEEPALGLGILAKEVPWSHHSNSTIVCRVTGKVVDDSEEGGGGAVVLPNSRVYSRKALKTRSVNGQPCLVCPMTGVSYPANEVKRVYIT